jgi:predicted aspartyl protease
MSAYSERRVARYQFATIPDRIATAVYIYPTAQTNTDPVVTKAAWDTGAQISVITPQIAKALNLRPVNQTTTSGAHGESLSDLVIITLEIPEQGVYENLLAAVCPFNTDPNSDVNMLVGMDVISQGDFVLSNGNGYTLFTFATPPAGQ